MPKLQELLDERIVAVKQAQALQDKVDTEKRRFTAEETAQLNAIYTDVESLTSDIDVMNRQINAQKSITDVNARRVPAERPNISLADGTPANALSIDYGRGNQVEYPINSPEWQRGQKAYLSAFNSYLKSGSMSRDYAELAMQADSAVDGGYMLAPQQMVAMLLKNIDDAVVVRQFASVYQVPNADSLGVVTLDTDVADADWTSELAVGSETVAKFGKRELRPHPLAKWVKISNKLLSKSTMPIESIIRNRLVYKFGIAQEKAFLMGDGVQKPLGLFTASSQGISTNRDYSTGNTTTAVTFDGLIGAFYNLKAQYQTRATWLLHRDALRQARLVKDTVGQYLWQPSLQAGQPDLILGRPYIMSEYVPNTFTTGKYVGMVGDLSYYWIADSLGMSFQRLVELFAMTNQVGIIGRMEVDGMPVLEEAFTRIKLA